MIRLFKQEIEDGLTDILKKNQSVNYQLFIQPKNIDAAEAISKLKTCKASANPNQIDLFYFESILASVGWNKNDDVFDPLELIKARNTAIDKPINFMHNEKDIIGHMTSSKIVSDSIIIADDIDIQNIPANFDIVVGGVLYKFWEDKDKAEGMLKLIAEIQESLWCVSLECIFPHFDYAVVTPDGQHKVIARTDESSFLTKHLRITGGEGVYQNHKIGRLLRDFTFSGEGIVDNPANPRSLVTSYNNKEEVSAFEATAASVEIFNKEEKSIMANELKYTEEQYSALAAQLADLQKANNETKTAELTAKANTLESQLKSVSTELDAQKEIVKAKDESVAKLTAQVETLTKELSDAKATIESEQLKVIKARRLGQLLEKGVAQEKAASLVEKFVTLADEAFEELVSAFPVVEAAKKEDKEDTKEDMKAECAAASKQLEEVAKTTSDTTLATPPGETQAKDILAKASNWLSQSVLKTTAKVKSN